MINEYTIGLGLIIVVLLFSFGGWSWLMSRRKNDKSKAA